MRTLPSRKSFSESPLRLSSEVPFAAPAGLGKPLLVSFLPCLFSARFPVLYTVSTYEDEGRIASLVSLYNIWSSSRASVSPNEGLPN